MRSLFLKSLLILVAFSAVSCFDESRPNYQYMPNMYWGEGYETYGEYDVFENGQEAKIPVEGTISRGWMPYPYENTNDGYNLAKQELSNPLPYTEENVVKGGQLYDIYCAICHGAKGDGKGNLVQREKILGVPSYDDAGRAITEGSVYHVMFFGRNAMGSYASQTTELERWQIDHYVMSLKNELEGNPEREFVVENDDMENIVPTVQPVENNVQEIVGEGKDADLQNVINN